jgi:hypothetical protein
VNGTRLRELRLIGSELRRDLALAHLRVGDAGVRALFLDLRGEDAALVEGPLRQRELVGELLVAARLRGLPLERVQVARDLGERVVDA